MSEDTETRNWIRTTDVPYPNIWIKENGIVIRDVTDDLQPYVIEHMLTYYLKDEPMSRATKVYEDPQAVRDIINFWKTLIFPRQVCIVALEEGSPGADLQTIGPDNPPHILGVNLLTVTHKKYPLFLKPEEVTKAPSLTTVFNTFLDLSKQINVFEKYNVDYFLDALGLSVHPDTRGKGLGLMILHARIELCRGLRIPITSTVFSAIQSQKISEKAGFKLIYEKNYDEYVEDGKKIFPNMAPTKTIQLKVHTINN